MPEGICRFVRCEEDQWGSVPGCSLTGGYCMYEKNYAACGRGSLVTDSEWKEIVNGGRREEGD